MGVAWAGHLTAADAGGVPRGAGGAPISGAPPPVASVPVEGLECFEPEVGTDGGREPTAAHRALAP